MSDSKLSAAEGREEGTAQVPPEVAALLKGLLPEQRRIVTTLDRPVFVAAGAGSGKTFTLTRRIVWALCPGSGEGGRPFLDSLDQALVITFTEKAAGEIKERVRSALRQAGLGEEALKVDSAWVSTIHHMCARILRAHALDLGLDPEFAMIGEQEARLLRSQATEQALREQQGSAGLDALYAEFGTGTGSGRDGVPGLLATLVSKAGSAERGLESLSFVEAGADVSGTMASLTLAYGALCACDLKHADELARVRGELARLEEFGQLPPSQRTPQAARELLGSIKGPDGRKWRAKNVKDLWAEVKSSLEVAHGEVDLACVMPLQGPLMALAERVEQLYAAAKRSRGVLDNDDLLQLTARAFREHASIADEYAHKFRLVMVDEFQDTNAQQVGMVKSLSGEGACHLTTVGDAQQAIYGFRGADVSVFEDRGEEVREAAKQGRAATVELAYNFRSDDAILRFVARACGSSGIVPRFMDLRPDPARKSDWPERRCPRVVVELTRAHRLGVRAVPKETRARLAAAQLADRLARIRDDAGVEPRRMAVLMRSLTQAPVYIDALRERGLESVVVGGSTFAQASEVRVVEALLRCLACPQDTKSGLFGVLESDMFELDGNDMLMLATRPQDVFDAPAKRRINVGVREGAPDFGDVAPSERLSHARRVITRAWDRVGKIPVADVLLMAIRESGWLLRLERGGVAGRAVAANVLAAVRHVRELSEPKQLDAILAADEFSRWLEAAKEGPASLSGEGLNAVSLMTAHASKGLEFDVVAVVGCCGSESSYKVGRLLSLRDGARELLSLAPAGFKVPDLGEDAPADARDCDSALEWRALMEQTRTDAESREDGRLLYVALTRARECVILCLSATEKKGGELSPVMTQQVAGALFGERPVAGEGSATADAPRASCAALTHRFCQMAPSRLRLAARLMPPRSRLRPPLAKGRGRCPASPSSSLTSMPRRARRSGSGARGRTCSATRASTPRSRRRLAPRLSTTCSSCPRACPSRRRREPVRASCPPARRLRPRAPAVPRPCSSTTTASRPMPTTRTAPPAWAARSTSLRVSWSRRGTRPVSGASRSWPPPTASRAGTAPAWTPRSRAGREATSAPRPFPMRACAPRCRSSAA